MPKPPKRRRTRNRASAGRGHRSLPGQVVLVLQGGGALGAFQAGVYQAMHEAGIEPDWVIGTSIGAINAGLIAGNPPGERLARLRSFWHLVEQPDGSLFSGLAPSIQTALANVSTLVRGIPAFFAPNVAAWAGLHAPLGVESASYYTTSALHGTLSGLIDLEALNAGAPRLTVGAVHVRSGEMRYFDTREQRLGLAHVMASGALPPVFPAIRIDGESYWDGGIYSNTPIEAVLDDNPRRDSVIFTVHMWPPEGEEPETIWQVMGRQKDIQYASRARSHVARQKQIHHLRHIIRELAKHARTSGGDSPEVRELASWGCGTTMHVVRLVAPRLDGEDHTKDIDFTRSGIDARWSAGHALARRIIERAPWQMSVDPMEGVVIHDATPAAPPIAAGVDGFAGKTR